jgi:hypothetical protein
MINVTTPVGWIDYSRFWDEMVDPLWNIRDTLGKLYRRAVVEKHLLDPKCVEYKVPAGSVVFTNTVDMVGVLETARKWAIMHQPTTNTAVLDRVKSDTGFASAVRLLRMANLPTCIVGDIVYNRLNPAKLIDDNVVEVMDLCTDIIALMPTALQNKRRCDDMAWLISTVVSELYTVFHAYCEHLIAVLDADGEDVSDVKLDKFVKDNVIGYLDKNELWSINEAAEELWLTEQDIAERKRKEREEREAEERAEYAKVEAARRAEEEAARTAAHKTKWKEFEHDYEVLKTVLAEDDLVLTNKSDLDEFFAKGYTPDFEKEGKASFIARLIKALKFIGVMYGCDSDDIKYLTKLYGNCHRCVRFEIQTSALMNALDVNEDILDARIDNANECFKYIVNSEGKHLHILETEVIGDTMLTLEIVD